MKTGILFLLFTGLLIHTGLSMAEEQTGARSGRLIQNGLSPDQQSKFTCRIGEKSDFSMVVNWEWNAL